MRSCYAIKVSAHQIAIADVVDYYDEGYIITRINVPKKFRRKGYGREILYQILDDTDREQQNLYVEVSSSGEMTTDQLREWYKKNGFYDLGGIMIRRPR